MSWIGRVAGLMGRPKTHEVGEAVRHAANAIDLLDSHCQRLGAGMAGLEARQAASEAVQAEHEWALTALREEIAALRQVLAAATDPHRADRTR